MNNFYLREMSELEADGIDFIIDLKNKKILNVIASYTKDELKIEQELPKTKYKFWKLLDGKKIYIAC